MTLSLSRMLSAVKASNDSAQSPAWSRNALPSATSPSAAVRLRASPANTSGGRTASRLRTSSSRPPSGHSGCWPAGSARQLLGVQVGTVTLQAWTVGGGVRNARPEPERGHGRVEALEQLLPQWFEGEPAGAGSAHRLRHHHARRP